MKGISMSTNEEQKVSTLSYADLLAAKMISDDYQLPQSVLQLSIEKQEALRDDPLTPVSTSDTNCDAQIDLLQSLRVESPSRYLSEYCRRLLDLGPVEWQFVAGIGKLAYINVKANEAVQAGKLDNMQGPRVAGLVNHWNELQYYVFASRRTSTHQGFASRHTVGR